MVEFRNTIKSCIVHFEDIEPVIYNNVESIAINNLWEISINERYIEHKVYMMFCKVVIIERDDGLNIILKDKFGRIRCEFIAVESELVDKILKGDIDEQLKRFV
ncbi:MAG: hypothetical protein ACRDDY_04285 [Clostridium sp.]|uniref:hypothetical protein n=1 Tax=Clostridium sp. TaxID=1506 RepID=UPI003EE700AB